LGGAGEDRVDGGKGKDTMTDFQPGQDKISILKPTVDTSSVGKNREKRSVGKNKHKSGK
jgi:Ca2+-binding RTX toxin-like protein